MENKILDFYDSCSTSDKQRLASLLIEDGLLNTESVKLKSFNLNDEIFINSLNILKDKRHLLTLHEENFINTIGNKFKYH